MVYKLVLEVARIERGKVVLCRAAQLRITWRHTVAIYYISNTYNGDAKKGSQLFANAL